MASKSDLLRAIAAELESPSAADSQSDDAIIAQRLFDGGLLTAIIEAAIERLSPQLLLTIIEPLIRKLVPNPALADLLVELARKVAEHLQG